MTAEMKTVASASEHSDLLHGVAAIAKFLNLRDRQARHHIAEGRIPTFTLGRSVCARKSSLLRWLEDEERRGQPLRISRCRQRYSHADVRPSRRCIQGQADKR